MLTSHELLGFMSPALALEILTYAFESDKPLYRSTLAAVAEARKLRPVFLERQPRVQRHAAMLTTLSRAGARNRHRQPHPHLPPQEVQRHAVRVPRRSGHSPQRGVVEDLPPSMEDAKLRAAIDVLLAKYPQEVVAVYLNAFNDMNQVEWPNLKSMLEADKRLQLGG